MTKQLNRMPTYQEGFTTKGVTTRGWYQFFIGLFQGQPTGLVQPITPTGTPYVFIAPAGGTLIVSGGTVSRIQFSRDQSNFYDVPTSGMLPVSLGDTLTIAYAVMPTLTFAPR